MDAPEPVLRSLMAELDADCEAILASGLVADAGVDEVEDVYATRGHRSGTGPLGRVPSRLELRHRTRCSLRPRVALIDFVVEELSPTRAAVLPACSIGQKPSLASAGTAALKGASPVRDT